MYGSGSHRRPEHVVVPTTAVNARRGAKLPIVRLRSQPLCRNCTLLRFESSCLIGRVVGLTAMLRGEIVWNWDLGAEFGSEIACLVETMLPGALRSNARFQTL